MVTTARLIAKPVIITLSNDPPTIRSATIHAPPNAVMRKSDPRSCLER
jgi:hypothetical protein